MNSLNSLLKVCHQLPDKENILSGYEAGRFDAQTPGGKLVADLGCEPILHMRNFQVCSLLLAVSYIRYPKIKWNSLCFYYFYRRQENCQKSLFIRYSINLATGDHHLRE